MTPSVGEPAGPPAALWAGLHAATVRWQAFFLALIIGGGAFVRVHRLGKLTEGFDAMLYQTYLRALYNEGLSGYPDLVDTYIKAQSHMTNAALPPTRFLYIFCSYVWHGIFGSGPLASLQDVSCVFGVATLVLGAVFAWRMAGPAWSLGVTALMATAPVQVHMSEHALIDGFFAFWATLVLWALWECLRAPDHPGWQTLYALSGALLVTTKENAFFVFVGVAALLALNVPLRFGKTTPRLLLLTVAGPLTGVVILVFLSGGLEAFINVYRLLVAKAHTLEYAIRTGDGPWYRYLLDLLTVSPLTLLLVVGAAFNLRRHDKAAWYFLGFFAGTYLLMCNVKYGMNLRYSTIWDLPLRYVAFAQLALCVGRWPHPRTARWVLAGGVALLCAYDLYQLKVLFYDHQLLELVPEGLLKTVKILK